MAEHETEVATLPLSPATGGKGAASSEAQPSTGNKGIWMGTAVGIGSAALVAALLYAKRRK
jgi:LPXTG-motif cell wall-anchored protein